jgi:hypothetical protein
MTSDDKGNITAFDDADGPSFSDILDIINPLQHIPVISTLYQHLTGDKEGAVADLAGGMLWGGFIGLGAAVVNLIVQDNTGKSIGDNVVALFSDDDKNTAVASGDTPPTPGTPVQSSQNNQATSPQSEPVEISTLTETSQTTTSNEPPLAGGGPIIVNGFMVFGGASAQPTAASMAITPKTATTTAAANSDKGNTGPSRTGAFMVFGAGQAAANNLPESSTTPPVTPSAPTGPQSLTPSSQASATPVTVPEQTATAITPSARSFPIPTHRNTVVPPQSLPMPTTGPSAVPGNSQAGNTARNGANVTGTTGAAGTMGPVGGGPSWFVGSFNQAMDKYNRAAGLGSGPSAKPPVEGETANTVLQMN